MKGKIQSMTRTQLKTGRTPRNSLKNYPDLQRALRVKNRMDNGFDIGLSDMSYKELVLVEHVNSWINEVKNREQRKKIQEMKQ